MLHVFIVNPAAGKGNSLDMVKRIEQKFKRLCEPLKIEITQAPGHATLIAQQYSLQNSPYRIYSVGGDGTLNEIVNGISGDHIELGIIPCGSGNDTIRSIYSVLDPVALLDVLPLSKSEYFDIGKINDRYFLNIASIGFDAEVAHLSRRFKKIPFVSGSLAYILSVLTALIKLKKYSIRLMLDNGEEKTSNILLCAFANGRYYGGGMIPAPYADLRDGLLDICHVESLGRLKILRFFPAFKKGRHETMNEVTITKFRSLDIESLSPLPVNLDGEVIKETRVSIKVLPGHLRIIIP